MQRGIVHRTAAILLAMLAQAPLITPYILSRQQAAAQGSDVHAMVFVQPVDTIESVRPERRKRQTGSSAAPLVAPVVPATEHEPRVTETIPLPAPESTRTELQTDWRNTMQDVAQDMVRRETDLEEHGSPLDSKPRILKLPGPSTTVPAIEAERLDNGDLITRHRITNDITVTCEHRQILLAQRFESLARSAPALCRISRSGMSADPGAVKPGYLSRPLPMPRAPEDPK
jgi:hypothetical protein